ncbi:hypothetical protein EVAR_27502_1 [Eumeta japonica]|uniref:Secreted protein n=1 Tax=Eumeta variegata TaxID=151549 RepID=A0A4C1XHD8_EUMVA|nr:hypothetical protein EVAR_27502_1 [Eumeta japonica]
MIIVPRTFLFVYILETLSLCLGGHTEPSRRLSRRTGGDGRRRPLTATDDNAEDSMSESFTLKRRFRRAPPRLPLPAALVRSFAQVPLESRSKHKRQLALPNANFEGRLRDATRIRSRTPEPTRRSFRSVIGHRSALVAA